MAFCVASWSLPRPLHAQARTSAMTDAGPTAASTTADAAVATTATTTVFVGAGAGAGGAGVVAAAPLRGRAARIAKEIDQLQSSAEGYGATLIDEKDPYAWMVTFPGPAGTPYEDGLFTMRCQFPKNYPFSPPRLTMESKIFHMHWNDKGEECYAETKDAWCPALNVQFLLGLYCKYLKTPGNNGALNEEAAALYVSDRKAHDEKARAWTQKYAKPRVGHTARQLKEE